MNDLLHRIQAYFISKEVVDDMSSSKGNQMVSVRNGCTRLFSDHYRLYFLFSYYVCISVSVLVLLLLIICLPEVVFGVHDLPMA